MLRFGKTVSGAGSGVLDRLVQESLAPSQYSLGAASGVSPVSLRHPMSAIVDETLVDPVRVSLEKPRKKSYVDVLGCSLVRVAQEKFGRP